MKLLHSEVEIVPGRPGMRPPVWPIPETQPIPGSAVVRLTNTTSRENAYTVKIRCEEPFWQDGWCSIVALPPSRDKAENAPPAGKPDQRGPHDRWVKLYVPRGGTRDVLLRFSVPQTPEARAGLYHYIVEVETQIVGAAAPGRRGERVAKLPAVAVIRPFYKWAIDMAPEQPRVGLLRRTSEFEVVVTNESNDWLYCDLQIPRPKDLLLEAPAVLLAVPPPEPGEMLGGADGDEPRMGVQRTVPLKAATRLKIFRGPVTAQSIMLSAIRVDAPSVAPPLTDASYEGWGAVVARDTDESQRLPGDRALNYCPPIPAKLTDFFTRSDGALRNLMMTVIGLVVGFNLLVVMYEDVWHNNVRIEPLSTQVQAGGLLPVKGEWLPGSKIMLNGEETPVKYGTDVHRAQVTVPNDLDGKKARLSVQRFVRFLPFLTPVLPASASNIDIQVGSPPHVVVQGNAFLALPSRQFMPGDALELRGGGLSPQGKIYLGGEPATPLKWTDDTITVSIPRATPPGPLSVGVYSSDNKPILASGSVNIGDPMAAVRAKQDADAQKAAAQAAADAAKKNADAQAAAETAKAQAAAQAASAAKASEAANQQAQNNPGNQQLAAEAAKQRTAAAQAAAAAEIARRRAQMQAEAAAQAQAAAQARLAAQQRLAAQRAAAAAAAKARRDALAHQNPPTHVVSNNGSGATTTTGSTDPAKSMDLTRQGYDLSSQGQYADAVNLLQQAVQLDPNNSKARDGLVTTLNNEATEAGRSQRYDDAIKMRLQALTVKPDDPFTKHSLALSYYNNGVSLYNSGQKNQAADQLKQSLKWASPGDSVATDAQNLINRIGR
ncbi:hypothetical protein CCAX7_63120 [Capsulimonas corticalis]|uniref:Uncharacterized protein n=1 Tax=Capsulimonas corticalis TaxID=2219043 RepID=A0A402CWT6_9BACT|nr:hypothetical protein [Capsulimonas corticalis]BDI34261.1 hypothetical protein CCAX7_63120 [Capsulimonas corticalis]